MFAITLSSGHGMTLIYTLRSVPTYTVSYENNVDYITERRAYLSNQIITSLWKLPASKTQSQSD